MASVGESGHPEGNSYKTDSYASGANKYWPTIFKAVELVLSVICIGLIDDPANSGRSVRVFLEQRTIALSYATFGAFTIICGAYLLTKLFRDTTSWKTSALFSFTAAVLFTACAAAILRDWSTAKQNLSWLPNTHRLDWMCAAGSVAIIAAVVFLIDLIVTLRQGARGDLD